MLSKYATLRKLSAVLSYYDVSNNYFKNVGLNMPNKVVDFNAFNSACKTLITTVIRQLLQIFCHYNAFLFAFSL